MKRILFSFAIVATLCSAALRSNAQIILDSTRLDTVTIASGLQVPWDMQWAGEDTILFTELGGKVKRLVLGSGEVTELYDFTEAATELQAGLMGMALHPNFQDTAKLFLVHSFYDENFAIYLRLVSMD